MKTQNVSRYLTQKIKTLRSLFTKGKIKRGLLSKQTAPNSAKSHPANLYRHCSETPLNIFIDVLVNHNHARLIKNGSASKEDIAQAWQSLFFEYCDMAGTKSYRHIFAIKQDLGQLSSRLMTIRLCLKAMSITPIVAAEAMLRKEGYNYKFDHSDPDSYIADLKKVAQKSKTIEIALQLRDKEYEKAMKEYGGKELTEHDFERNLVELSKYMGFRLNPCEIMVSEYLAIQKKYETEAEQVEAMNAKLRK